MAWIKKHSPIVSIINCASSIRLVYIPLPLSKTLCRMISYEDISGKTDDLDRKVRAYYYVRKSGHLWWVYISYVISLPGDVSNALKCQQCIQSEPPPPGLNKHALYHVCAESNEQHPLVIYKSVQIPCPPGNPGWFVHHTGDYNNGVPPRSSWRLKYRSPHLK